MLRILRHKSTVTIGILEHKSTVIIPSDTRVDVGLVPQSRILPSKAESTQWLTKRKCYCCAPTIVYGVSFDNIEGTVRNQKARWTQKNVYKYPPYVYKPCLVLMTCVLPHNIVSAPDYSK